MIAISSRDHLYVTVLTGFIKGVHSFQANREKVTLKSLDSIGLYHISLDHCFTLIETMMHKPTSLANDQVIVLVTQCTTSKILNSSLRISIQQKMCVLKCLEG